MSTVPGSGLEVRGGGLKRGPCPVLQEVDFRVDPGQVVAVLGPNGSGKTSLLRLVAGLEPGASCSGVIRVAGRELSGLRAAERARLVAYVGPDLRTEFPVPVLEAVLLGRLSHSGLSLRTREPDRQWALGALDRCGISHLASRELRTLSGGERQLVALARALTQDPQVLLLDETLSQMDLHHQARMGNLLRDWVRAAPRVVLLVAHDMNLATEWSDRALLLRQGRVLAEGPVAETVTPGRLEALYPGARIRISPSPVTGRPKVFFE